MQKSGAADPDKDHPDQNPEIRFGSVVMKFTLIFSSKYIDQTFLIQLI